MVPLDGSRHCFSSCIVRPFLPRGSPSSPICNWVFSKSWLCCCFASIAWFGQRASGTIRTQSSVPRRFVRCVPADRQHPQPAPQFPLPIHGSFRDWHGGGPATATDRRSLGCLFPRLIVNNKLLTLLVFRVCCSAVSGASAVGPRVEKGAGQRDGRQRRGDEV